MVSLETFEACIVQKLELEKDYTLISNPLVDLNKSHVIHLPVMSCVMTAIRTAFFHPATLSKGRQVNRLLDTKLG
jgi:hypothetical protein